MERRRSKYALECKIFRVYIQPQAVRAFEYIIGEKMPGRLTFNAKKSSLLKHS
jgi:hypothetical protein